MNNTLPVGQCPNVSWCDQGSRPHERHEVTPITLFGEGWTQRGTQAVQLVVHGWDDTDAVPMLALVDTSGRQVDAVLEWQAAHTLATEIIAQCRAHTRRTTPD